MGLIKTILIFTMIWYALKMAARFVFPIFLKRFVSKMEAKMRQQQGFQKEEKAVIGETSIDKKAKEKSSNNAVGEYVDFEEVD